MHRLRQAITGARPVTIIYPRRGYFFQTGRAGDDRLAIAAANTVNESQRRSLAAGEPAVAELHHRHEARIKLDAGLGQAVFDATRRLRITDLTKYALLRQPLQPLRQCGTRQPERRAKSLKAARTEERFPDDKKGPRI